VKSTIKFRPLTGLCILAAVVFVIIAIVYFAESASNLPSFFPGHQAGLARHHVTHGIAMIVLAAVALIAAWFSTAPGSTSGTT